MDHRYTVERMSEDVGPAARALPVRVQRRRSKGWKMPPNTVSVTRPGRWENPFKVGGYFKIGGRLGGGGAIGAASCDWMQRIIWEPSDERAAVLEGYTLIKSREHAVAWFRRLADNWTASLRAECQRELAGRNLACWCPLSQPCHADVLLEIANAPTNTAGARAAGESP